MHKYYQWKFPQKLKPDRFECVKIKIFTVLLDSRLNQFQSKHSLSYWHRVNKWNGKIYFFIILSIMLDCTARTTLFQRPAWNAISSNKSLKSFYWWLSQRSITAPSSNPFEARPLTCSKLFTQNQITETYFTLQHTSSNSSQSPATHSKTFCRDFPPDFSAGPNRNFGGHSIAPKTTSANAASASP